MTDRTVTSIHREIIDHPSAWTGKSIGGKGRVSYRLTGMQLDALDGLLLRTSDSQAQAVGRQAFDHPVINELMAELRKEIMDGCGIVVVTGATRERFGEVGLERICWGFGTHLGIGAVQSARGDKLGHVRHEPQNPKDRGYMASRELKLHSDAYEVLGLMCIQNAHSGGESRVASALAVHNEILLKRPDLLVPLYRGFPYATAEASGSRMPVTPYPVPVFSCVDGWVSCMYTRAYMHAAAERLKIPLPADLAEALKYFEQVAERDDIVLRFMLDPGEMLICNNFTTVHARTAFTDSKESTRHLLRLWLRIPGGRPVIPALEERGAAYERIYQQDSGGVQQAAQTLRRSKHAEEPEAVR
jgi:Taurine catabolism dioxygenase TauD, TfdA family